MTIALLLIHGAFGQALFGSPDSDGDGVIDSKDECWGLRETHNDFHDEDGCPDFLPGMKLVATYMGQLMPAEAYLVNAPGIHITNNEPPVFPVQPNTQVTVAAVQECLEAQATFRVRHSTTLMLELIPNWNVPLAIDVRDAAGNPVPDATITWLGSSTPGCAPSSIVLESSSPTVRIGRGSHRVRIEAPGMFPIEAAFEAVLPVTPLPVRLVPVINL